MPLPLHGCWRFDRKAAEQWMGGSASECGCRQGSPGALTQEARRCEQGGAQVQAGVCRRSTHAIPWHCFPLLTDICRCHVVATTVLPPSQRALLGASRAALPPGTGLPPWQPPPPLPPPLLLTFALDVCAGADREQEDDDKRAKVEERGHPFTRAQALQGGREGQTQTGEWRRSTAARRPARR